MAKRDVLIINGVDFSEYLTEDGLEWTRNDLEASGAGRTTMDGLMHRSRIAVKVKLQVTCMPLMERDVQRLLHAIYPPMVSVTYIDPMEGMVTRTMYTNNVPLHLKKVEKDGRTYWNGLKFPLIEQ